jgi:hypothetical protein
VQGTLKDTTSGKDGERMLALVKAVQAAKGGPCLLAELTEQMVC